MVCPIFLQYAQVLERVHAAVVCPGRLQLLQKSRGGASFRRCIPIVRTEGQLAARCPGSLHLKHFSTGLQCLAVWPISLQSRHLIFWGQFFAVCPGLSHSWQDSVAIESSVIRGHLAAV